MLIPSFYYLQKVLVKSLLFLTIGFVSLSVCAEIVVDTDVVPTSDASPVVTQTPEITTEHSSRSEVTVTDLLGNVVNANRYYSYDGLLTYEASGTLTTLKLQQRVDADSNDHRIYQTLEFLDGVSRRVVRDQPLKVCSAGNTRWGLWPHTFNTDQLKRFYQPVLLNDERVAGRMTYAMALIPQDNFRYAYRFNIDQLTGLLLRTVIIEEKEIVERTQFVSIQLNPEFDEAHSNDTNDVLWRVPEVEPCHSDQFQSAWYVSWLPDGFVSVGNRVTAQGEQVLMFSDGLVSVSVFITSNELDNIPKVTARRGATVTVMSALSSENNSGLEAKTVAVVGEVPTVVARRIAVSVKAR